MTYTPSKFPTALRIYTATANMIGAGSFQPITSFVVTSTNATGAGYYKIIATCTPAGSVAQHQMYMRIKVNGVVRVTGQIVNYVDGASTPETCGIKWDETIASGSTISLEGYGTTSDGGYPFASQPATLEATFVPIPTAPQ